MLDIKFIRENPNKVKKGCKEKQVKVDIDKILELDKKRRKYLRQIEELKAKKRKKEKEKGEIEGLKEIKKQIKILKPELKEIEKEFKELMLKVPNLPQDDVPEGKDERDNIVLREVGEKPKFDFKPRDYLEIGKKLDLIDIERAAKTSGTRFGFLKNEAVLLEFALINLAFDNLLKRGFIPVIPPVMMKAEMMKGMGYIEQTDKEEAYYLPKDDLFLAGTAEQPIGTMHAGEIFEEEELPRRYVGFSTCFRREAGAYGKDTKGIFRVHQFDKVEMFSFCQPEESKKEHQFFLEMEEKLMQALKIPYRVVQMCTADLGFPTAAKYDLEAWLPSEGRFRETHSTSNCTDFQSRRLNIRYRQKDGKLNFVHTVNGTVFSQRPILAIIENYQTKNGKIVVPKVLQKYLPFKEIPHLVWKKEKLQLKI